MGFITTLVNGLSLGGIYALIALGYTMVYGIAKMLNFAHGDVIMIGAYTIMVCFVQKGMPSVVSIAIATVACCLLGIIMEKLAYKPLRGASPLAVLITAIGVSYLLQSLVQYKFSANPDFVSLVDFGMLEIGSFAVPWVSVLTLAVSAVIMTLLSLFIKKTKIGRAMVAVSEDKGAASLMGVNVNGIITLTFAIGSALAGIASAFYLMKDLPYSPTMGSIPGIKAFTAAVFGGIGSIPGAMVGGIFLGVVECLCKATALSPYTDAIEFSILIIILMVRPNGLFGRKKREKV